MISLEFHIYTDEDIKRIIYIKNANKAGLYIFKLTNTKIYFLKIIIPFFSNNGLKIVRNINDPTTKRDFVEQFQASEEVETTSLVT